MPRHDPSVSLRQMRDYAREALGMAQGRTRADLESDRMLNLSLVHLLELLGEAAGRVPPPERADYPRVPWAEIVGLRNRLIHGYDQVDLDIVWQIISKDLPPLVDALERILSSELPTD